MSMNNDTRLLHAVDRLLSGEMLASLARDYPECMEELRSFVKSIAPLRALSEEKPSTERLRKALASTRLSQAEKTSHVSYSWYYLPVARLVFPVLILTLAVGGYFALSPRKERTDNNALRQPKSDLMRSLTTERIVQDGKLLSPQLRLPSPSVPEAVPVSLSSLPQSVRILAVCDPHRKRQGTHRYT